MTYQAILEEGRKEGEKNGRKVGGKKGWRRGRIEELHRMILRQGRGRFGETDEAIRDIDRLEDLSERLVIVSSWDGLMA